MFYSTLQRWIGLWFCISIVFFAEMGHSMHTHSDGMKVPFLTTAEIIPLWDGSVVQETVRGRVLDAQDETPLPGVNVVIQGTSTGTVTDLDGMYELNVPSNDIVLIYSYIGYISQEISIEGRNSVDVLLEPGVDELGELVVVGYGEQRRRDLTGSIASVPRQQLTEVPVYSMDNVLQGRV